MLPQPRTPTPELIQVRGAAPLPSHSYNNELIFGVDKELLPSFRDNVETYDNLVTDDYCISDTEGSGRPSSCAVFRMLPSKGFNNIWASCDIDALDEHSYRRDTFAKSVPNLTGEDFLRVGTISPYKSSLTSGTRSPFKSPLSPGMKSPFKGPLSPFLAQTSSGGSQCHCAKLITNNVLTVCDCVDCRGETNVLDSHSRPTTGTVTQTSARDTPVVASVDSASTLATTATSGSSQANETPAGQSNNSYSNNINMDASSNTPFITKAVTAVATSVRLANVSDDSSSFHGPGGDDIGDPTTATYQSSTNLYHQHQHHGFTTITTSPLTATNIIASDMVSTGTISALPPASTTSPHHVLTTTTFSPSYSLTPHTGDSFVENFPVADTALVQSYCTDSPDFYSVNSTPVASELDHVAKAHLDTKKQANGNHPPFRDKLPTLSEQVSTASTKGMYPPSCSDEWSSSSTTTVVSYIPVVGSPFIENVQAQNFPSPYYLYATSALEQWNTKTSQPDESSKGNAITSQTEINSSTIPTESLKQQPNPLIEATLQPVSGGQPLGSAAPQTSSSTCHLLKPGEDGDNSLSSGGSSVDYEASLNGADRKPCAKEENKSIGVPSMRIGSRSSGSAGCSPDYEVDSNHEEEKAIGKVGESGAIGKAEESGAIGKARETRGKPAAQHKSCIASVVTKVPTESPNLEQTTPIVHESVSPCTLPTKSNSDQLNVDLDNAKSLGLPTATTLSSALEPVEQLTEAAYSSRIKEFEKEEILKVEVEDNGAEIYVHVLESDTQLLPTEVIPINDLPKSKFAFDNSQMKALDKSRGRDVDVSKILDEDLLPRKEIIAMDSEARDISRCKGSTDLDKVREQILLEQETRNYTYELTMRDMSALEEVDEKSENEDCIHDSRSSFVELSRAGAVREPKHASSGNVPYDYGVGAPSHALDASLMSFAPYQYQGVDEAHNSLRNVPVAGFSRQFTLQDSTDMRYAPLDGGFRARSRSMDATSSLVTMSHHPSSQMRPLNIDPPFVHILPSSRHFSASSEATPETFDSESTPTSTPTSAQLDAPGYSYVRPLTVDYVHPGPAGSLYSTRVEQVTSFSYPCEEQVDETEIFDEELDAMGSMPSYSVGPATARTGRYVLHRADSGIPADLLTSIQPVGSIIHSTIAEESPSYHDASLSESSSKDASYGKRRDGRKLSSDSASSSKETSTTSDPFLSYSRREFLMLPSQAITTNPDQGFSSVEVNNALIGRYEDQQQSTAFSRVRAQSFSGERRRDQQPQQRFQHCHRQQSLRASTRPDSTALYSNYPVVDGTINELGAKDSNTSVVFNSKFEKSCDIPPEECSAQLRTSPRPHIGLIKQCTMIEGTSYSYREDSNELTETVQSHTSLLCKNRDMFDRTKSLDVRSNRSIESFEPKIKVASSVKNERTPKLTHSQSVSNIFPVHCDILVLEKLSSTSVLDSGTNNVNGIVKPPRKAAKKKRLSRKSSKSRSFSASSPNDGGRSPVQFASSYLHSTYDNNHRNLRRSFTMSSARTDSSIMSPTTGYDCRADPHLWPGWWRGQLSQRLAATVPTQPVSPCDTPTPPPRRNRKNRNKKVRPQTTSYNISF